MLLTAATEENKWAASTLGILRRHWRCHIRPRALRRFAGNAPAGKIDQRCSITVIHWVGILCLADHRRRLHGEWPAASKSSRRRSVVEGRTDTDHSLLEVCF